MSRIRIDPIPTSPVIIRKNQIWLKHWQEKQGTGKFKGSFWTKSTTKRNKGEVVMFCDHNQLSKHDYIIWMLCKCKIIGHTLGNWLWSITLCTGKAFFEGASSGGAREVWGWIDCGHRPHRELGRDYLDHAPMHPAPTVLYLHSIYCFGTLAKGWNILISSWHL